MPINYTPTFEFNEATKNYDLMAPALNTVKRDLMLAFARDIEGKIRRSLIDMGWMPPEVAGDFKAAFRANMLRRAQPGEDIDAEIDRVFAQMEKS